MKVGAFGKELTYSQNCMFNFCC